MFLSIFHTLTTGKCPSKAAVRQEQTAGVQHSQPQFKLTTHSKAVTSLSTALQCGLLFSAQLGHGVAAVLRDRNTERLCDAETKAI